MEMTTALFIILFLGIAGIIGAINSAAKHILNKLMDIGLDINTIKNDLSDTKIDIQDIRSGVDYITINMKSNDTNNDDDIDVL